MHNAVSDHPLTNAQPDPEQHPSLPTPHFLTPQTTPPIFIVQHDTIWYGTSLWSVWVSCPGRVLSECIVQPRPPHWQGSIRNKKKSSAPCKHCSATTKSINVVSPLLSSKFQNTALCELLQTKLALSQPLPWQKNR